MSPTTTSGEETVRLYQSRTAPSRGSEALLRIACAAMGALVLTLGLVATTDALAPADRIWPPVIGMSAIMAVAAFLGQTRSEHNKTRAAQEVLTASVREELRKDREEIKMRLESLTGALMEETAELRLAKREAHSDREAMDATVGDLAAVVRSQTKVILGIADRFKDPADQEAEWFQEAVELGRNLEREEARRRNGGATTV